MTIIEYIFFAFWFFLPAGLANMFPIFAAHTPGLKQLEGPMDFGFSFRRKRIFGENKTWRGFIVAGLTGVLAVWLEKILYTHFTWVQGFSPIDYARVNVIILGLLLGLGAIMGDALESFFKRQLGILAGASWLFFDQIDFIIGAIALSYWYVPLSLVQYLYIIAIYFVLHLISAFSGFLLGLKRQAI